MRENTPTKIEKFLGLNTQDAPEALVKGEFREALNLYVTNAQQMAQREAPALITAGDFHSLETIGELTLIVQEQKLLSVDSAGVTTELFDGLTAHEAMSYEEYNGDIFFSNGIDAGMIQDGVVAPWGMELPAPPATVAADGSMPAGKYVVYVAYQDTEGAESVASLPARVQLYAQGGINVIFPKFPSYAEIVNVYVTLHDGVVAYLNKQVPVAQTSVLITAEGGTAELTSLDMMPAPPSRIVRKYGGRLIGATGSMLWFTDPYNPRRYRPAENYYLFPVEITMVEVVDTGVYIGADKIYFLEGPDMLNMKQIIADTSPAIFGTGMTLDSAYMPLLETNGTLALWLSGKGFMAGANSGEAVPLSENKVTFPVATEGAMAFLKQNGTTQLLSLMREPADDSNTFGMQDRVIATVIKNGVQI